MSKMSNEYHLDYNLSRYRERRNLMLEYLGGACVECGTTDSLEIHHIDPDTKSFDPCIEWGTSLERLYPELDKCELRCEKHHKDRHVNLRLHGSHFHYQNGCRCDACLEYAARQREKNRIRMQVYRAAGYDKTRRNYQPGVAQQVNASAL
jgi:hypothetical protein